MRNVHANVQKWRLHRKVDKTLDNNPDIDGLENIYKTYVLL